jgi:16S rRNA (guanine527-N7)-methyltransferase
VTPTAIRSLLDPYLQQLSFPESGWTRICEQLSVYLDLILKWNARTNLTAIRTPEEIVRRHFGESLFVGTHLGACNTLLDFGSGAGFPGVPIQLLRPDLQVTLGESQGKKAAFLREVCRELVLTTEVFSARIETMPPNRKFDVVAMRAVDQMGSAILEAVHRASDRVVILTTLDAAIPRNLLAEFSLQIQIKLPQSDIGFLEIFSRNRD